MFVARKQAQTYEFLKHKKVQVTLCWTSRPQKVKYFLRVRISCTLKLMPGAPNFNKKIFEH